VTVSVTTVGGTDAITDGFTYVAAPTLTAITPDHGSDLGGDAVTLTGTGLTGTTGVTFDGVPASDVVVVDDGTVTATSPAHAAGAVDVQIVTPGGSATLVGGFTYEP
jgi:hypothetical protein